MECKLCTKDFEPEKFPFGDDVTCPHCGVVNTTDWDYTDAAEGCMVAWTTGLRDESSTCTETKEKP